MNDIQLAHMVHALFRLPKMRYINVLNFPYTLQLMHYLKMDSGFW